LLLIIICAHNLTLFPSTTLFRSSGKSGELVFLNPTDDGPTYLSSPPPPPPRKSGELVFLTAAEDSPPPAPPPAPPAPPAVRNTRDRKSTRLNSSHDQISYAVFCL